LLFAVSPGASAQVETANLGAPLCAHWVSLAKRQARVSSSTGDRMLDRQLALEANRLSRVFDTRPAMKILYGPEDLATNALADSSLQLVEGTQGAILVGKELLELELRKNRRNWGGLVIAGVLAHEFAHMLQYKLGYYSRLSGASLELHADFLAGYYLGLKKREGHAMDIGAFMDGAYVLGDYSVDDPDHHGTPAERRRAVRSGYQLAVQSQKSMAIAEAARVGAGSVDELLRTSLQ
jgi:hypothetical protein